MLIRIQSVWDGDDCNRFIGTDSTIFPPFLKPEEGLWTYTPDICNPCRSLNNFLKTDFVSSQKWIGMSLKANFIRKSSYAGLPSSIYGIDFGDFKVWMFLSILFSDPKVTFVWFALQNQPEKHCFCHDPPNVCPPKGTIDLTPCVGSPIYGK